MDAANLLQNEGFDIEVIDIRTVFPLDTDTILESVKKTNKVLIAHEDNIFHGFGAEIAAQIAEFAFEHLDAPVCRVAGEDVPIGFSPVLEKETLPQVDDILNSMRTLLSY